MTRKDMISAVIPVYRSPESLDELHTRLMETFRRMEVGYEIIFVNDASPANDWDVIRAIAARDNHVTGINLSRNFGQQYALTAGLDHADGDWVIVMDCDLQDRPEEIPRLYKKALEGFDIVVGLRTERKDPVLKRLTSRCFYRLFSCLTGQPLDSRAGAFRILSRRVVEAFRRMRERFRFFGGLIHWLGFPAATLEIEHSARKHGRTSYTLRRRLDLALNGFLAFSDKPLRLSITLGVFLSVCAGSYILILVARNLLFGTTAVGWSSLIASIFFSTGVIVSVLGIVGLYVGKTFEEVKARPLYVIQDLIGGKAPWKS